MPRADSAELTLQAWALLISVFALVVAAGAALVSWIQARHAKRSANAAERSASASETSAEHAKKWADIEGRKRRAEQAYVCLEDLHGFKDAMLRITRRYHSWRDKLDNVRLDEWIAEFGEEREAWFRWHDRSRIWFDDPTVLAIERVTNRSVEILQAMRKQPPDVSVEPYADHPHQTNFVNAVSDARELLKGHLLT